MVKIKTHQCQLQKRVRAARVAQRFSAAFSPGRDPGDSGLSPTSGSLHGACFSLCLCLCLSLTFALCVSLSWINKIFKKRKRKFIKVEIRIIQIKKNNNNPNCTTPGIRAQSLTSVWKLSSSYFLCTVFCTQLNGILYTLPLCFPNITKYCPHYCLPQSPKWLQQAQRAVTPSATSQLCGLGTQPPHGNIRALMKVN